jgi:hypothetical protein
MSGLGRARRASVADRIQHVANLCGGEFRRHASRRVLTGDVEGPFASVRIGAVLHPAVLLALTDGAGFLQHADRPAAQRPDRESPSLDISIEIAPGRDESLPSGLRSRLLTQGRDSELSYLPLVHVFRRLNGACANLAERAAKFLGLTPQSVPCGITDLLRSEAERHLGSTTRAPPRAGRAPVGAWHRRS